ncbi:MAG: ABC transporter permease [Tenericutes bacterium]|jgi:oligopeptide transport system permease protein|nr:ABC transporter permease [Mycoplasmatota bacterium]
MFKYILKRLIYVVLSIVIVMGLVFVMLDSSMAQFWGSRTILQDLEISWFRMINYAKRIFEDFYFGLSLNGTDVWGLVWPKFKLTMMYNLIALAVFVPSGVFLGIQAAIHKNKLLDVLISVFAMIFNSIPSFVLIFFLVMYVGYAWGLLPPFAPSFSASLGKQLLGLIIPIFALAAWPTGKFAQIVKGEMIEILNSDRFLLLRAKGLTKRQSIYRHGIRESLVTVIPEIIPTFMMMVGFSFVVETTYNIYGVSMLLLNSMIVPGEDFSTLIIDVNVVVAICLLLYGTIMIASLFTDVLIGFVDPRIHITGKNIKTANN